MKNNKNKNLILKGIAASSGIVIGRVFLLKNYDIAPIDNIRIPLSERSREVRRFHEAVVDTKLEMNETREKINKALGESYAKIADVHLFMLEDPIMIKDVTDKINKGISAEYAVYDFTRGIALSLEAEKDGYFKERAADIKEVSKRIIHNLISKKGKTISLEDVGKNSVVVAHNLTPADTVSMKEKFVLGFATDIGGKTSHTAIVANGLGIPAVVGLANISQSAETGDEIIIDGNKGLVILNPEKEILEKYKKEIKDFTVVKKELEKLKDLPASTIDGYSVEVFGNIENPNEAASVLSMGAAGIGLYRTEFIYFNRADLPDESDHFDACVKVVENMNGFPTVIRTADLGGDKLADLGLLKLEREKNPFMGLRAIRLCLKYPDLFIKQLRGILRASAKGKINLLYPMISNVDELREADKILQGVKEDLRKEKIPFDENIKRGIMIEVPCAAMISDILAKEVDFFSIGTNDLIQYSMAADRVNENVARLYDPLHPAILRFIKMIIDSGHNAGIKVAMCGEMAGDPFYTPILLGLGLDEFSVSLSQIPKIKKIVRSVKIEDMKEFARQILQCGDRDKIEEIVESINLSEDKTDV
ncbi:MAG: phosphoenolpyruvate--protein phosphotransferase [Elusimicrobiota bacterium]|jgi:phosphotransferase system enzyme I (PtsI)|nr:phosphoenolpyruvate--protein phosphotransferase [Elusimicrobiota bacterium]